MAANRGAQKKKIAVIIICLGMFLPSLSVWTMPDSLETSIRRHDFVLAEGSAQVTVTEGPLAGKTFSGSQGRVSIPYAYIFGAGAVLILSGVCLYGRGVWEARQVLPLKYYRDA